MRGGRAVRVVGPLHWIGYPALAVIAASLVFATPVRLFSLPLPEPIFPMVLAFAWPLIRPSMLAPLVLLLAGLFLDLLWGGPMGLWALCLLSAYGVILFARPLIVGQDVRALFGWYVGVTVLAYALGYVFVSLDVKAAPSLVGGFLQVLVTVLLFPLANNLIERFDDGDVRFR